MVKREYLDYNIGHPQFNSVIDALHAASPQADINTGKIVRTIIQKIDASGIISKVSRTRMNLNRPINDQNRLGVLEYRQCLRDIVVSKGILNQDNIIKKKFLHISVHGMAKSRPTDFEIGTRNGEACSKDIRDWFCSRLQDISINFGVDSTFPGDSSKAYHRLGDPDNGYIGYGDNFNTIQFEINHYFRNEGIMYLVDFLCNTIIAFELSFNK